MFQTPPINLSDEEDSRAPQPPAAGEDARPAPSSTPPALSDPPLLSQIAAMSRTDGAAAPKRKSSSQHNTTPKRAPPAELLAAPRKTRSVAASGRPAPRRLYTPGDEDDCSSSSDDSSFASDDDTDDSVTASSSDSDSSIIPLRGSAQLAPPAPRPAPVRAPRPVASSSSAPHPAPHPPPNPICASPGGGLRGAAAPLAGARCAAARCRTPVVERVGAALAALGAAADAVAVDVGNGDVFSARAVCDIREAPFVVRLGTVGRGVSFEISVTDEDVEYQIVNVELARPSFVGDVLRNVGRVQTLARYLADRGTTALELFVAMCGVLLGNAGDVEARVRGRLLDACGGCEMTRELVSLWLVQPARQYRPRAKGQAAADASKE